MQMRIPSIPLITVDPYFSVWSYDNINDRFPTHWTGSRNAMLGTVTVDGNVYRFLGSSSHPALRQISADANALSSTFVFEGAGIELTVCFTSPILIKDLYYASRPVSYMHLSFNSTDGAEHSVSAKLSCSEELVLNKAGEGRAYSEPVNIDGVTAVRMGKGDQKILWRCGDDVRIDWGYLYLGVRGNACCGNEVFNDLYAVYAETELKNDALFLLAYDDIDSIMYFEQPIKAYWKKDGKTIEAAVSEAAAEYETLKADCDKFSAELTADATAKGGSRYAELLALAYRQVMAAHKLAVDPDGNNIYISKECFSNGCAATVDVTYPSSPLYLYYNTELLKGMLRPIFRYANSDEWNWDFAPHDAGCYPFVNGQAYWTKTLENQMPVEECGNMIILVAAICKAEKDYAFAKENFELLSKWSNYLEEYGEDPEHQLCTDDFAGHLSHNCNLAIKAVMGLAGFSDILNELGKDSEAKRVSEVARKYAVSICERSKNPDGSYRLAFDREGTFSLKYNSVWDRLWNTDLFPEEFYKGEIERYKKEALPYGVPLDTREKYTKSDWLLWVACLTDNREDFEFFVDLLHKAYGTMRTRVPMTDWYYTDTSHMRGFQNRTVQGGLFLKLMFD